MREMSRFAVLRLSCLQIAWLWSLGDMLSRGIGNVAPRQGQHTPHLHAGQAPNENAAWQHQQICAPRFKFSAVLAEAALCEYESLAWPWAPQWPAFEINAIAAAMGF